MTPRRDAMNMEAGAARCRGSGRLRPMIFWADNHLSIAAIGLLAMTASAAPRFEPHECAAAAAGAGARCGTVHVPENHARPRGRQIPLNVVVLPATGQSLDARRAQYDLEGGPGF